MTNVWGTNRSKALFAAPPERGRVSAESETVRRALGALDQPVWVARQGGAAGVWAEGEEPSAGVEWLAAAPPVALNDLGDASFGQTYATPYAYYAGSMANGISSEEMVIEMGRAGWLASFGAGGLSPARVEAAIQRVRAALPNGPYAFNVLNSPNDPASEQATVDLYLKYGVRVVEASAYLTPSAALARYRAAGLSQAPDGGVRIQNRVIAKLSRKEVARKFLEPPSAEILNTLAAQGAITARQAELARLVPLADDITVEADSGGHTDHRPLVALVPAMLALRDEVQAARGYAAPVRIGAAGGIGAPAAALAAFMLGAAYVVTGSVNQACVESGASEHTRRLLAQAEMTDVANAPAGDMFEMGVKVQVLKRGTMFSMRAQKLYELYSRYEAWEQVPAAEREKLEKTVFQRTYADIWEDCVRFFTERDPRTLERARANPRDAMALVFRWYLGMSSRWSNAGEPGREMDYQIWCGPAMGAFNDWTRGTRLAEPGNRRVVEVAEQLMTGAAYLYRLRLLEAQGARFSADLATFRAS